MFRRFYPRQYLASAYDIPYERCREKGVRGVIFDIDNTLYDYDAAHAVAFQALTEYAQHTLGVDPEEFESLHQRANQLLQARTGGDCAAIHNRLLRYQILLEELGKPIGSDVGNSKSTFATIMGREACESMVQHKTESAKESLRGAFDDTRFLEWLADMLAQRRH